MPQVRVNGRGTGRQRVRDASAGGCRPILISRSGIGSGSGITFCSGIIFRRG
jgi:hypothetical protein